MNLDRIDDRGDDSQHHSEQNERSFEIEITDRSLEGIGIAEGETLSIERRAIEETALHEHRGALLCFSRCDGELMIGISNYPYIVLPYRNRQLRIGMSGRRVVGVVKL